MHGKKPGLIHMRWRDLFVFILAPIHLQIVTTGVKAATPSLPNCPMYALENETISCTCQADDCRGLTNLTWVGLNPPTRTLQIQQVKVADNGKQYTCLQICDGQTSTVNYTLRVAYGPYNDKITVSGDQPFKTNGTQVLNLTCLATDVNPAATYYWRGSHCDNVTNGSACSFVPQREDDLKVETCWARNPEVKTLQSYLGFTINLNYTPPASPLIHGPGQILKAEDNLSCTVNDGKPLVQSVHFSCENPHHPDQNDAVNSTTVTSYITIDTSNATEDNMTCHCSAHWAPEPSYYTTSASASFRTEYPAKIKTFTLNGITDTVTVNASDQKSVTLMCEAHGLPSPTVTLQGPQDHDLSGNLTHTTDTYIRMEHTIMAVNETHMGNYTCKAVNDVTDLNVTSLVTLDVHFPPRLYSSDGPGHSRNTAVNMTEHGIDIHLRACPTPDSFNFTGYKDKNSRVDVDVFSVSSMFTANASKTGPGNPEITCQISPGYDVQKEWLYMVNISNGFGSVQYYFNVIGVPSRPAPDDGDDTTIIIVVTVISGGATITIIAIVVVVRKKRKEDISDQGRSNPTFNMDDHDNNGGIGERESKNLDMSTYKPDSVGASEVRDDVMKKKSSRGQEYEVTSLVDGGGARIDGETTKLATANSNGVYAEPWTGLPFGISDVQPTLNKAPAHTKTKPSGNNASPDYNQGPRGEEYASIEQHDKGGNKDSGKVKHSDAVSTHAGGSDVYDDFGRQGQEPTQHADPTYNRIVNF